jgi:hypothetical protein
MCSHLAWKRMNLSYLRKLVAIDRFPAIRASFQNWKGKFTAKYGKKKRRGRHLTVTQRKDISTDLQDSTTGPVTMIADVSDREAVCYEGEIANVLEDTGFKVEVDNAGKKAPEQEAAKGLEMTISDKTVRPMHATGIVRAFRRAGVAIATRINAKRRKNNTLYITVGSNDVPARPKAGS